MGGLAMTQTEALDMIAKLQIAEQAMEAACKRIDELKAENKILKEAQRTWVGLTDEEIEEIFNKSAGYCRDDFRSFAKSIEAKLKEKNT